MTDTVGVLGGTFDPVHLGHVHVATGVRRVFALSRVLLMPSPTPPHKDSTGLTPTSDRLAMLLLAVEGHDGLEVSSYEIDRDRTCYTIDTMRSLRRALRPVEPLFILGMDALAEIDTWRDHEALLAEFDLVVVDRPGGSIEEARRRLGPTHSGRVVDVADAAGAGRQFDPPPGKGGRVFHLAMRRLAISSSRVRRAAAVGAPLLGLVPPGVADYILEHRLYRGEATR